MLFTLVSLTSCNITNLPDFFDNIINGENNNNDNENLDEEKPGENDNQPDNPIENPDDDKNDEEDEPIIIPDAPTLSVGYCDQGYNVSYDETTTNFVITKYATAGQ